MTKNHGNVRHGHKREGFVSPTYRTWLGMKRRCYDKNYKDYKKYGARGITVCDRWNESFVMFLSDMGERPNSEMTIDRLDPSLGYSPENCRWATKFEQGSENKSNLRAVTIDGVKYNSLAAACRHYGLSRTTLNERLKRGIPLEEAITSPTWGLENKRPKESYIKKDRR